MLTEPVPGGAEYGKILLAIPVEISHDYGGWLKRRGGGNASCRW